MVGWKASALVVALAIIDPFQSTALLVPLQLRQAYALRNQDDRRFWWRRQASSSSPDTTQPIDTAKNTVFIQGLMNNLSKLCDRYICDGSPKTRERVFNVLDQIAAQAVDRELVNKSIRMVKRAGVPMYVSDPKERK